MATRYYIVGGAYYTWEQLHNQFGYTDHETSNISYKSANTATWGDSAGSGYFDGDQTDMVNGSFWSDEDPTAWFDLSGLVYNAEVYPADATDCAMEKDGVRSDAVSIESDGVTYYLIRNVWDSGWMSESEAAAEGWEPAQPGPVLPVVYTHTGTQTAASIAPDASFDTGLTYDSNNLYIGETNDGLGDVTRYGWEAAEGPEPPAYTEITLYGNVSSTISCQNNVTSGFTGNVNTANVLQLYTDNTYTTPWNGYDYSNDYEMGVYSSDVWYSRGGTIADLPATTANPGNGETVSCLFILLDTGCLWFVCNNSNNGYGYNNLHAWFYGTITLRIYPKAQQHYPAYFNNDNAYANNTFTATTKVVYFSPTSGASARLFGHYIADNGTLVDVLDSGGSSVKKAGDGLNASSVSGNSYLRLEQSSSVSRSARVMTFTLPHPTFIGWINANHTNQTVTSGTPKKLLDDDGNEISYNANLKYTAVCIFAVSNSSGTESLFNGLYGFGSDDTYPGALCFKQVYGSVTVNRIWIITETVCNYIWAYFTASGESATTNTSITSGNAYLLYDANGNAIVYDPSKAYETLELQYHTSNGYLMRGNTKFDTYSDNGNGQLQAIARFTNTSDGARRIKIGMKPQSYSVEVNFGDPVTIPAGYEVESVKCERLFVKASSVTHTSGQTNVNSVFLGQNEFCDLDNANLITMSISPCLGIFAYTSTTQGYWISYSSSSSPSTHPGSVIDRKLNSDGVFVSVTSVWSGGGIANTIADCLASRPALFRYYDSNGTVVPYYFRIQTSLWQFQNGTFSWLGDTTDSSDLAYWYNTRAVRINLRPSTT